MEGDVFVKSIMSDLNRNLATGKRTLAVIKDSGDYTYKVRDGSVVEMSKEQVDLLWDVADDSERLSLRLPIYVSTDTSSDIGAWKVEGKSEAAVVARLLGKTVFREGYLRLYHPDLKDLKARVPDLIMMVFTP